MEYSQSNFFIQRNLAIIRAFYGLTGKGIKVREACKMVAKDFEGVEASTVDAIVYQKNYAYAKEARELYKKEQEEAKQKAKSA